MRPAAEARVPDLSRQWTMAAPYGFPTAQEIDDSGWSQAELSRSV